MRSATASSSPATARPPTTSRAASRASSRSRSTTPAASRPAELAERAAGYGFAALWCSPLLRARETAEIVSARIGLEPREDARLMETDAGRLDRPHLRRRTGGSARAVRRSSSPAIPPSRSPAESRSPSRRSASSAALRDDRSGRAAGARRLPRDGDPRSALCARRRMAAERPARAQRRARAARPRGGGAAAGRPRGRGRDGGELRSGQLTRLVTSAAPSRAMRERGTTRSKPARSARSRAGASTCE